MRRLGFVAALVGLLVASVASPAAADGSDEAALYTLINEVRAEQGLEPLTIDITLIVAAREHAVGMAEGGELFHSSPGELAATASDWELIGENVGRGPSVNSILDAFLESESHRANVLGEFDRVGVGVERGVDGGLFAAVVFMQRSADAPDSDPGTLLMISGLPEFAVTRLLDAVSVFDRSGRELCSQGSACID